MLIAAVLRSILWFNSAMSQWITLSICLITLVQYIDTSSGRTQPILFVQQDFNITFHSNFSGPKNEFKVSLIKGMNKSEIMCMGSFNNTQLPYEYDDCIVTPLGNEVTFHLRGLSKNKTDIYFFRKEVMYPPPYNVEFDEGTIIHITEEHTCKKAPITESQKFSLSLWVLIGGFVLYSIIITTAFVYVLTKGRKKRIQQSEYFNVIPQRPKNHKTYVPYVTTPVRTR